ncbi:MAG: hypothetical protein M3P06_22285 [Acidobacteriota bacterium]|nr:hypothetical protein [Acidobacteriota bacterium]
MSIWESKKEFRAIAFDYGNNLRGRTTLMAREWCCTSIRRRRLSILVGLGWADLMIDVFVRSA